MSEITREPVTFNVPSTIDGIPAGMHAGVTSMDIDVVKYVLKGTISYRN
jgi:hypothetical protein